VLNTIPYFKSVFTIGMSETANTTLQIPIEIDELVFREFLRFVYLRDRARLITLSPSILLPLLELSDYYGFEELIQCIVDAFRNRYAFLSGEIALELLSTIHPFEFQNKKILEEMALEYIAFNFSEAGKLMKNFHKELEREIYENVIDYIAQ